MLILAEVYQVLNVYRNNKRSMMISQGFRGLINNHEKLWIWKYCNNMFIFSMYMVKTLPFESLAGIFVVGVKHLLLNLQARLEFLLLLPFSYMVLLHQKLRTAKSKFLIGNLNLIIHWLSFQSVFRNCTWYQDPSGV